jgi:hypothetical protein
MTLFGVGIWSFAFGFSVHAELSKRHVCIKCALRKFAGKAFARIMPTKKMIHEQTLSWWEQKRVGLGLTIAMGLIVSELDFAFLKTTFKEVWNARKQKAALSKMRD